MAILTVVSFLSSDTFKEPSWRRQTLSERYQIPEWFWTTTCSGLNGCFGCENLYGDEAELRGHSRYIWARSDWRWRYDWCHYGYRFKDWPVWLVTWFRFFIKQLAGYSSYASDPKYTWHEMGFFTRWLSSGIGSVVCFDIPASSQKRMIDALGFLSQDDIATDAYAFHMLIADEAIKLYDDSVWRIRNVVRNVETSRYSLFVLQSSNDLIVQQVAWVTPDRGLSHASWNCPAQYSLIRDLRYRSRVPLGYVSTTSFIVQTEFRKGQAPWGHSY